MNILHLRASNFYGGPERQLHLHAIQARSCGYAITVGSFTENGHQPEFLDVISRDGINTHSFSVKNSYDFKVIRLLKDFLTDNKIDILCTHDYRTLMVGFLATRGISTRWIAFSRGWTEENLKVRFYHSIDKFIIRYADHIVAVSDAQKARLRKLSIPENKISVVHNAIDIDMANNVEAVDLRRKFNLHPDSIICLSAGRFSREKGQEYLVEAAKLVIRKNSRFRFILFGDGPNLANIKKMVSKSEYPDHFICPGYEKNLLRYIKGADILVNPSLSEGLPNIVLEGMALGVPVVATAVGGVPELITNMENGILVPPGDAHALADGLLLMSSPDIAVDKISHAAIMEVRDRYSFEKQMNELSGIYRMFEGNR